MLNMDELINAINHALDMGKNRLQWYMVTGDNQNMVECKEWNKIASYYMNQLIVEQKSETCESTD
jgi:hypothetical protein